MQYKSQYIAVEITLQWSRDHYTCSKDQNVVQYTGLVWPPRKGRDLTQEVLPPCQKIGQSYYCFKEEGGRRGQEEGKFLESSKCPEAARPCSPPSWQFYTIHTTRFSCLIVRCTWGHLNAPAKEYQVRKKSLFQSQTRWADKYLYSKLHRLTGATTAQTHGPPILSTVYCPLSTV